MNEGKPGRPPGLQPEGCPEPTPGDAADTKQTRVPDDGHDEFDVTYNPIAQTNINQSEAYDLPKVGETASFACHDWHGIGPIDFIPTAEAIDVHHGLVDPTENDPIIVLEGRDNTTRRQFYDILMAIVGLNGDSAPNREVYKTYSHMWAAQNDFCQIFSELS